MKRTRRPTEEAALARIMREEKRKQKQSYLNSARRTVFGANATKWLVWIKPEFRVLSTEDLRRGWQARGPGMSFLTFLERDHIIYRKEEIE